MADHASSTDAAVQRQLDRLWALSPQTDVLGLERITALLARLGNPERRLPPVFHVAGTNGKGSTCAFLRAAIEAAGLSAHVYTSPHLVRFNERIRVAGTLIEDAALARLLAEVLDVADGIGASFFEVTTAAAFLAFAHTPADAGIIEVGLGGRLDATNVVAPAVCGIAQLGIDHQAFLGDTIEAIAREKAGIAKAGVPLVTQAYSGPVAAVIGRAAAAAGAPWLACGAAWRANERDGRLRYSDRAGALDLPLPSLAGPHQAMNAALAVAMLRHQDPVAIPAAALASGMEQAAWPARLQRLDRGKLAALLPAGTALWLDGGHNPAAAEVIARFVQSEVGGVAPAIVLGMLANKDLDGFLAPFAASGAQLWAVPVPSHDHHDAAAVAAAAARHGLSAQSAASVVDALQQIGAEAPPFVLIAGSLYLAGEALRANGTPPT